MKGKQANQDKGIKEDARAFNPKRARGTSYPEQLKIKACVAALTTNPDHPLGLDSLNAAMAVLNAPIAHTTLNTWLEQYRDQVTALMPVEPSTKELVNQQYNETVQAWSQVERLTLEHLVTSGKIGESSARDAAVVAGIARTHLAKMISLDSALVDSVTKLQAICQRIGIDVKSLIDDYITVLERTTLPTVSVNPVMPATSTNQAGSEIDPDTTTD